jgi:DNA-binding transcriptional regulator YiaG
VANFVIPLQEEIRRLARKEIKAQVGATKQTVAGYRREIAALKRALNQQARRLAALEGRSGSSAPAATADAAPLEEGVRFSRRSVKAQRARLGLSAHDYGRLVGVSGLTIYNWEQGKSRPRAAQLAALAAVRNIGKRAARAKLAASESAK